MPRPRWKLKQLLLVVLTAGLFCGGAELARRYFSTPKEAAEPPGWPWLPGPMTHFEVTYVNTEDVRKGIKPPRMRVVSFADMKNRPRPAPVFLKPPTVEVHELILVPRPKKEAKP